MLFHRQPIHDTSPPGDWGVDSDGSYWYIVNRKTLQAKRIGRVGCRGVNYFDRAMAQAALRNTTGRAA
jgi:hypothetical protein